MTLDQFISDNKIGFEQHSVYTRPDGLMDGDMAHYRIRIKHGRRAFGLYFSQGRGITHEPILSDVLDCMASDAAGYENASDFEQWAAEYGYDNDSRKAEKIYMAVKRQSEQLRRTLGDDLYEQLLWNTERL